MSSTPPFVRYHDVNVGDELPSLEIPLTRTLIVSTGIASRDFQDVHHDPDLARAKGSKDIFMNILTTNGLVSRFVTDWAGPNAVLKAIRTRLGAPNYPGDTMRMTGSVVKKDAGIIEVSIRGANSLGDHVTGTVVLALAEKPIAWAADAEPGQKAKKKKRKKTKKRKRGKK